MGILSLYLIAILAVFIPFVGRGCHATSYTGPCQPFKANQTKLCDELQAFVQFEDGTGKFCNDSMASCFPGRPSDRRKDPHGWRNCYCDERCKDLGECCVDYKMPSVPLPLTRIIALKAQSCRRAPSDMKHFPYGYIMVARCPPDWNDTKTADACTSINYSADPLTALPVSNKTSNVTYANTYCAMCHGKSRDLHPWDITIYSSMYSGQVSLQDITSPGTVWEAVPFAGFLPERCISIPSKAFTEPDTKNKKLCRSYVNGIEIGHPNIEAVFRNPHCAIIQGFNLSAATEIVCSNVRGSKVPWRPDILTTIFTFSGVPKRTKGDDISISSFTKTVYIRFNCSSNELYDPFKDRCLVVKAFYSAVGGNGTNATVSVCRGPRFHSDEFRVFSNNSILLLPHQKIYPNGSYILVNRSLVLCSNFFRNYTKRIDVPVTEKKTPPSQPLTAVHIITFVGFSLSIIFLLFLLVTYFLFAELRTYPGKRVMHLSCAMIAMQSVYLASDPDVVYSAVCAVVGAMLHFFILASFLWMSAIAHDMKNIFTVMDVNPSSPASIAKRRKAYIRDSLFCWVSPLVVVGICVALQLTSVGNVGYGTEDGCQLSVPARTYAVACPVSFMLVYNIYALIRTGVAIKIQSQGNMTTSNQRSLPLILVKLTVVMGITWLLGFLLAFYRTPYIEYPFVIVNSFQGVLICISFVFKKNVFALYKQKFMTETHPREDTTAEA